MKGMYQPFALAVLGCLGLALAISCGGGSSKEETIRLGQDMDDGMSSLYSYTRAYIYDDGYEWRIGDALGEVYGLCFGAAKRDYENADYSLYSDICDRFDVITDGTYGDVLEYIPDLRQDLRVLIPD